VAPDEEILRVSPSGSVEKARISFDMADVTSFTLRLPGGRTSQEQPVQRLIVQIAPS
jgi:hypothetical protein